MKGKVNCTCGWSWNKSDSSKKDMYICHECGRDNSNNMKNGGWLDNYGTQGNYNDSQASAPEGMVGDGFSNVGRNYSPAWGGQFQMGGNVYPVNYVPQAQTGASMPGSVGFTYARTKGIPSEGPYAKKTLPSAQNGQEMQYYREGLDWKPKTISQYGKKIKIKDERLQSIKPSESTSVKRKDFDLEQAKENKAYINAVAAQKKEVARRSKLTQDQREREDYNAYNEERGSIKKYVPETTWERTKAIVSNPMTALGYKVRGENLPKNFQAGPRNEYDYAIDWINPLQGAAALSEIPGELGRGEFLEAGLSALDAVDLGVYAKGATKASKPLLQKAGKAVGTDKLNFKSFKPNPEAYYRKIGNEGYADALESGVIRAKQQSQVLSPKKGVIDISENFQFKDPYFSKGSPSETYKGKYMVEATNVPMQVRSGQSYSSFTPKNELQLSDPNLKVYKKHWLQGYKEVPKQEDGGIIKDDRGQWDHPGEITEINSNQITMQGVPYDVIGISDTGDTKLMKPGKNYKFKGKKVTEFPMAKNGLRQEQKGLVNLDNLLNFTNYNTKQPGGWLDSL